MRRQLSMLKLTVANVLLSALYVYASPVDAAGCHEKCPGKGGTAFCSCSGANSGCQGYQWVGCEAWSDSCYHAEWCPVD